MAEVIDMTVSSDEEDDAPVVLSPAEAARCAGNVAVTLPPSTEAARCTRKRSAGLQTPPISPDSNDGLVPAVSIFPGTAGSMAAAQAAKEAQSPVNNGETGAAVPQAHAGVASVLLPPSGAGAPLQAGSPGLFPTSATHSGGSSSSTGFVPLQASQQAATQGWLAPDASQRSQKAAQPKQRRRQNSNRSGGGGGGSGGGGGGGGGGSGKVVRKSAAEELVDGLTALLEKDNHARRALVSVTEAESQRKRLGMKWWVPATKTTAELESEAAAAAGVKAELVEGQKPAVLPAKAVGVAEHYSRIAAMAAAEAAASDAFPPELLPALGLWEVHTRRIGSKLLMRKMGFHGQWGKKATDIAAQPLLPPQRFAKNVKLPPKSQGTCVDLHGAMLQDFMSAEERRDLRDAWVHGKSSFVDASGEGLSKMDTEEEMRREAQQDTRLAAAAAATAGSVGFGDVKQEQVAALQKEETTEGKKQIMEIEASGEGGSSSGGGSNGGSSSAVSGEGGPSDAASIQQTGDARDSAGGCGNNSIHAKGGSSGKNDNARVPVDVPANEGDGNHCRTCDGSSSSDANECNGCERVRRRCTSPPQPWAWGRALPGKSHEVPLRKKTAVQPKEESGSGASGCRGSSGSGGGGGGSSGGGSSKRAALGIGVLRFATGDSEESSKRSSSVVANGGSSSSGSSSANDVAYAADGHFDGEKHEFERDIGEWSEPPLPGLGYLEPGMGPCAAAPCQVVEANVRSRRNYFGIEVLFPHATPMKPQEDLMMRLVCGLVRSKHALLESPTGTGKSAALLCAALAWQRSQCIAQGKAPRIFYGARTHSQLKQMAKELRATPYRPTMAVLGSRKHLCAHPHIVGGVWDPFDEDFRLGGGNGDSDDEDDGGAGPGGIGESDLREGCYNMRRRVEGDRKSSADVETARAENLARDLEYIHSTTAQRRHEAAEARRQRARGFSNFKFGNFLGGRSGRGGGGRSGRGGGGGRSSGSGGGSGGGGGFGDEEEEGERPERKHGCPFYRCIDDQDYITMVHEALRPKLTINDNGSETDGGTSFDPGGVWDVADLVRFGKAPRKALQAVRGQRGSCGNSGGGCGGGNGGCGGGGGGSGGGGDRSGFASVELKFEENSTLEAAVGDEDCEIVDVEAAPQQRQQQQEEEGEGEDDGSQVFGCPYYTAQALAATAQLVLCPYNYLLDPQIRNAMTVSLKGAVVLLDEAHNIEGVCRDAGSVDTRPTTIMRAMMDLCQLSLYHDEIVQDDKGPPAVVSSLATPLLSFAEALVEFVLSNASAEALKTDENGWMSTRRDSGGVASSSNRSSNNNSRNNNYTSSSKSSSSGRNGSSGGGGGGFSNDANDGNNSNNSNKRTGPPERVMVKKWALKETSGKDFWDEFRAGRPFDAAQLRTDLSRLQDWSNIHDDAKADLDGLGRFLIVVAMALDFPQHYCIVLQRWPNVYNEKWPRHRLLSARPNMRRDSACRLSHAAKWANEQVPEYLCELSLWLMAPAVIFEEVAKLTHSVVLTSGTLSPLSSFRAELGPTFAKRLLPPALGLEADHCISPHNQLLVCAVPASPPPVERPLHCVYNNTKDDRFIEALGFTVVGLASMVPEGVLVFLPSYALLSRCRKVWENSGVWSALEDAKGTIVQEPTAMAEFAAAKRRYETAIVRDKQALLLAVYRGKMSEGISFNDSFARAVICVGIPYPNARDLKVTFKKDYNDWVHRGAARVANAKRLQSAGGMGGASYRTFAAAAASATAAAAAAISGASGFSQSSQSPEQNKAPQNSGNGSPENGEAAAAELKKKKQQAAEELMALSIASGDQWYRQQAFRALNQALGRCIRHIHDYGAIFLLDTRHVPGEPGCTTQQLASWIRQHVQCFSGFPHLRREVHSLFQRAPPFVANRKAEAAAAAAAAAARAVQAAAAAAAAAAAGAPSARAGVAVGAGVVGVAKPELGVFAAASAVGASAARGKEEGEALRAGGASLEAGAAAAAAAAAQREGLQ